jgi:hypothetical protein
MWPQRDLIDLLEIDHPVVQAPMGGESKSALAAAVSNVGHLGGLGCSFMSLKELRSKADEIRSGTNRPFNLNSFAHPVPRENTNINAQTRARVAPFYEELGLAKVPERGEAPCETFNGAKLSALLDICSKVTSFHFGLPPIEMVKALQDAGSVILCSATTVTEARMLNDTGVDAIIAQGWEAGGHRGTFHTSFEDLKILAWAGWLSSLKSLMRLMSLSSPLAGLPMAGGLQRSSPWVRAACNWEPPFFPVPRLTSAIPIGPRFATRETKTRGSPEPSRVGLSEQKTTVTSNPWRSMGHPSGFSDHVRCQRPSRAGERQER